MSPKRWILLLIFYISYLLFGAAIYYHIEHGEEKISRANELKERIEINAYLLEQLDNKTVTMQNEILEKITDYCGKPVTDYTQDEYEIPYTWTFYHAFFFSFTVCSTVGYGNISPSTTAGRMIMIVYSVIGIPVNGILFAGLGDYFSRIFQSIYRRYKKYKMTTDIHYVPPQLGLITTVAIALIPGVALFLLLPAWVFSYFEDWPYSIAFYYSYVTTTTIGFGDYVPTFGANQPREFGGWFVVYQIFIIVWFIFSLGYLLMIMTFITRGLQSKKLDYLEQQLSSNLKATQNRIWNGVTKDVGYLRRLLNELYILKVKPVYTDADFTYSLPRSASCPELSMYRVEPAPLANRKRAYSVCAGVAAMGVGGDITTMVHASSDTELSKFDREKTFETAEAYRQTTDLLAKVVTALATVKPPPPSQQQEFDEAAMYGGYHGFSDSQIMASEWSFSTVNDMTAMASSTQPLPPSSALSPPPRGGRARACSDFNIETPRWRTQRPMLRATAHQNEWTWSGDNQQIQEAFNKRYNSQPNGIDPPYIVHLEEDAEQLKKSSDANGGAGGGGGIASASSPSSRTKKFSMPDGLRKLFQRKRPSQDLERKLSIVSVPEGSSALPDYYSSTLTMGGGGGGGATPRYARAQTPPSAMTPRFASSNGSLNASGGGGGAANGGGFINHGFQHTDDPTGAGAGAGAGAGTAYHRKLPAAVAAAGKRRRESIYTPNPAMNARRGSMYPPSVTQLMHQHQYNNNAHRRGSLAATGSAAMAAAAARRGSLFPAMTAMQSAQSSQSPRRSSIFSVSSDKDMDVLEQTTLADLIRALEVVHTHAVLDEQQQQQQPQTPLTKLDKKQRKMGNAGLDPPQLPSILSLFAGDQTRTLQAAAANRLYARRSTIVGTMPAGNQQLHHLGGGGHGRRPSGMQMFEPPPSYTEKAPVQPSTTAATTTTASSSSTQPSGKFRRRFSVRPTALQIPPGQAPPPTSHGIETSQTSLQRRLSLRPSPLARELSPTKDDGSTSLASSSSSAAAAAAAALQSEPKSSTRLLPQPSSSLSVAGRPSTSSTHSPLSRIVQISQAQRKSSMPKPQSPPPTPPSPPITSVISGVATPPPPLPPSSGATNEK